MAEAEEIVMEESTATDNSAETRHVHKIDGKSIDEYTKEGLASIVEATKCTNVMPSGTSRNLYSAYPAFTKTLDAHSAKILSIIHRVIKKQQVKGNIQKRDNEEQLELMLECNDVMLERINSNLDILSGVRKNTETILVETEIKAAPTPPKLTSGTWNENRKILTATHGRMAKLLTARNIVRPQINFKVPVDNSATTPFEPRLKYKPHSLKPLAILAEYADDGSIESYLHPYEFELGKWEPSAGQLKEGKVCEPAKLNETPLVFVDTDAKLKAVLNDLSGATEIAVDVEHHSYRTFQGITCLLQLSTRQKDYIIDTLALRDELHALNEAFTNPKILKVFHGADSDVEWLQRDLSIYIVNMFDTHQAAKRLGFARLSLAFLLKHYCNIDADKSLQLADWRMRPLPDELITYARQDTHYLLYIHDLLRQELLKRANGQTNLLLNVYQSSTEICKRRYVKVKLTPDSHMELYRKSKRIFDNRQLYAFKELFAWRDSIARSEDESYGYVLPNHMMLQIAESLPREMQGILACCNPIPPLVRQHLHVLHKFILKAREQPLVKIVLDEQLTNRSAIQSKVQDLNSHLYCPHDIPVNSEFRDDLPTLLGQKGTNELTDYNAQVNGKVKSPSISVFLVTKKTRKSSLPEIGKVTFVSPYSRYLAVLPFAEKQRAEELAREAEESRKRKLCPEKHVTIAPDVITIKQETGIADSEQIIGALKDYGKPNRDTLTLSVISDDDQQPQKKRRVDVLDLSTIEKKLDQIRNKVGNQSSLQNEPTVESSTGKWKNSKKGKSTTPATEKQQQNSNKTVDFDYTKVDFKKFQGGSQRPQQSNEFKSKFQGKGKNNKANKQFNKLFSFSKVGKKK